jgi:hypothetical protein
VCWGEVQLLEVEMVGEHIVEAHLFNIFVTIFYIIGLRDFEGECSDDQ